MKMKKLFEATAAACLLLASLAGCTAETPLLPNEVETDDDLCTFTLSAGSNVSVDTRAINETTIKDVWVVQLNATGTAALTAPQYLTADATGKIRAKLEKVNSKVYFLANTNSANLFNPAATLSTFTTATVEAVEITQPNTNSDWGTRTHIPMYGTWTGTPQVPNLTGNATDKVELVPVLAKVNYVIKMHTDVIASLDVKSYQIKNVPSSTRMAPHPATVLVYPATNTSFLDYPINKPNQQLWAYGGSFYMPENCRGTGPERYETEKNGTLQNGGEFATYLEVVCMLRANNAITITYRFFLGENNINDYNVKRGYSYTVDIKISGMNPADARMTIEGTATLNGGATINKDWGSTNDAGSGDLGINS